MVAGEISIGSLRTGAGFMQPMRLRPFPALCRAWSRAAERHGQAEQDWNECRGRTGTRISAPP
jgi:hypothetical protein